MNDLFPKPRRKLPRVMMKSTDQGSAPGFMPGWKTTNGGFFECSKCGHVAGWLFNLTMTDVRKGVPCPVCNSNNLQKIEDFQAKGPEKATAPHQFGQPNPEPFAHSVSCCDSCHPASDIDQQPEAPTQLQMSSEFQPQKPKLNINRVFLQKTSASGGREDYEGV